MRFPTPFLDEQLAQFVGAQTKTFIQRLHVLTAYVRAEEHACLDKNMYASI